MAGYNFKDDDYLHVIQCYNRIFDAGHVMPNIHRHSGIEIMYVLSGKAVVRVYNDNAEQTEQYNLSSGEFFFFESDRYHRLYTPESVTRIVNLEITPGKEQQFPFQRTVWQMMQSDRDLNELFSESRTFRLFDNGELLRVMQSILYKFHEQSGQYALIEALLTVLFSEVAELYKQNTGQYRGYAYVKRAVSEIENDVTGVTPDRLAEAVGISRVYLQKLFRECFGMGIAEYINQFRLERAKAYLRRNPSAQIGEVAEEFGFHSVLHFERVFKKLCGCSPRDFREKARETPEFWTFESSLFGNEQVVGTYEGGQSLSRNSNIIKIV